MEWIDKSSAANAGAFTGLADVWITAGKVKYSDLDEVEKNQLKAVLRTEQKGYCALCMELMAIGTNDHVVPQSVPANEFSAACRKGPFRRDFVHQRHWTPGIHFGGQAKYYPHTIAYGNMVCMCQACNTKKDNGVISPTFFNRDPGVSYDEDGTANCPNGALNLNLRTHLNEREYCRVRKLWHLIKSNGKSVDDVRAISNTTDKVKLLESIGLEKKDAMRLAATAQWDRLLRFAWFGTYYQ